VEVNPANALEYREVVRTPIGRRGGPRRLAVVIGSRWPVRGGVRLSVQFLDSPPAALRTRILAHMNAWSRSANVQFTETNGLGEVRIARLDRPAEVAGYWSYLGTEILGIEADQPTMNLEGFTMRTAEAEFRRVVRHEAGHTLGFDHEHMRRELVERIDRAKAIAYHDREFGWTAEETKAQVLTPLARASIMGTREADPSSIMCYQIPGSITKDGKPIKGGRDINARDHEFAGRVYPKPDAITITEPTRAQPAGELAASPVVTSPVPLVIGSPRAASTPSDRRPPADDSESFHLVVMDGGDMPSAQKKPGPAGARYARLFASYGGARVTAALRIRRGPGEPPTAFGRIIAAHHRITKYTNGEGGSLPSDPQMLELGGLLFETLFQDDVRRLYDEARSRQRSRRLDFVLTSMIPWIAEKPWEFAYDRDRRCFLATEEVHFVRNVLTAIPADAVPPRSGPLRILVASAQPISYDRLSVEQETEVIRRGFAPLIEAGLAEVDVIARVSPAALHERLAGGDYTVAHFIGHGEFDEQRQEGCLVFENERGGPFHLPERSVRELFCQRGLGLVFLNACQSGTGGRADFNKGVAQSLVAHGLPALVANQYSVLDSSATSFAQHFYRSLAQGLSLGEAAREARIAVNYTIHSSEGDPIDWAVPVVYARDPRMTLAPRPAAAASASAATLQAAASRAASRRRWRVAVWDIDGVFPGLERTLEQMQDAQRAVGFSQERMSLPMGVWNLETRAPDGNPYLMAERLAERLKGRAAALQVDVLACITRHWMYGHDWENLYAWWPRERKPPVILFSCAGFDTLPAEGAETDRAIANLAVAGLAGFFADVGAHLRGPKSCPMWFNADRDPAQLTRSLAFDKSCRAAIKRSAPELLEGLEALLKRFH
jgi:hypothetical protein